MCGIPSVRQLLRGMTSSEVTELIDYARYPFGEKRADLRAALQSAHAAAPYMKKGSRPIKPLEYALRFDGEETTDGEAEMAKLAALIPGAKVIDRG